jgi:hypothetical protein
MFNIKDKIPKSNPINTITGSYASNIILNKLDLDNIFYLPSIFNESDLEKQYIEDKKKLEKYLYDIELVNINLLIKIRFLNKRYCFVNITHNNTTNFIMKNYIQIKKMLDNYVVIYNKNLYKINLTKEKINNINLNILSIK